MDHKRNFKSMRGGGNNSSFREHCLYCCRPVLYPALYLHPLTSFLSVSGDEVVPYKHGEKSTQILSSSGFRSLTFKAYDGYLHFLFIYTIEHLTEKETVGIPSEHIYVKLCRLGHYTVPKEMDEVCHWLNGRLGLEGSRS